MTIPILRLLIASFLAIFLALRGYSRNSLSLGGACAAMIVGFLSLASGYQFGIILLVFYFSGTRLTKIGSLKKLRIDANYKIGGQRDALQVLATSGIGTILAVYYYLYCADTQDTFKPMWIDFKNAYLSSLVLTSYIGHYACAAADTWASEIGVLSNSDPILITTFQRVPPGTNGGISLYGTLASIAGGSCIGVTYFILSYFLSSVPAMQFQVIPFASFLGFVGCMIDSLLGATCQKTLYDVTSHKICDEHTPKDGKYFTYQHISGYNILSNEQVNLVSVILTTVLSSYIASWMFF